MDDVQRAILRGNVEASIASLIEERKVKYISNSLEFVEGLKIGLEIAGLYGNEIKTLYTNSIKTQSSNINDESDNTKSNTTE